MRHALRYLVFLVLALASLAIPFSALAAGSGGNQAQRYIVTLQPGTNNAEGIVAQALARQIGFHVDQSYDSVIQGFAARLTSTQLQVLSATSQVASIQQDEATHITDQTVPTGVKRIGDTSNGTAKIDGGGAPLDIDIATLDSGIDPNSTDLNVAGGFNATNVSSSGTPTTQQCDGSTSSGSWADDNGHGTHVAGTIAAIDNGSGVVGVAPGARLWAVKVFDRNGNGYVSYIICGMDWIAAHASTIKAVNFSGAWGGTNTANCGAARTSTFGRYTYTISSEDTAHEAVCHLVNDLHIPMIVAAGNDGANASNTLPAAYPETIAVGAIADSDGKPGGLEPSTSYGKDDTRASFSNYGSVVTIYAPGVNILSTWPIGNTNDGADGTSGLNTISGTSMATPHVTGAVALYLLNHPGATPTQVKQALVANGDPGSWGSPYGSQPLLDVNNTAFGPPVPTHNMSVDSVTPSTPAVNGQANSVSVKVTNNGSSTETGVSVTLKDGPNTVGTQGSLSFSAGQSQTLTFTWTPGSTGSHTLTATVTYNSGATANNSATVNVEALTHLLTESTTALSTPVNGQQTTIRVHVTNTGNQTESSVNVALTGPGTISPGNQTIPGTLAPGASADVDFTWTPNASGSQTLNVTLSSTNFSPVMQPVQFTVVDLVHDVTITSINVPTQVTQGSSASVTVGVKNNGDFSENISVSLASNPAFPTSLPVSQSVTLAAGGSTTLTFNVATTLSTTPGSFQLSATASIAPVTDASPGDNSLSASNNLQVNEKPAGVDIWVTNMTGTAISGSRGLYGSVYIGSASGGVSGATVTLSVTGPSTTTLTATTATDGRANFAYFPQNAGTYTVSVTNVVHASDTYTPSENSRSSVSIRVR